MLLLLIFFSLSLICSFLCSIWEAVLLSITPSYVNAQVRQGAAIGARLEAFKRDIDRPLSAILTLNTVAHTVGAIGVGAQASTLFDASSAIFGVSYESIVAAAMTLAILILSEIIPKTLGANNWRALAPFTVISLTVLTKVLLPFVWMSQGITRSLKRAEVGSVYSRADFLLMASEGEQEGVLNRAESEIMTNLLRLDQLKVEDIMTPKTVMRVADESMTMRELHDAYPKLSFSRVPIHQHASSDLITGFVLKSEVLQKIIEGQGDEPLSSIRRPLPFVNVSLELAALLDVFTKQKSHVAICTDQFGTVTGLVTMEDLFETLLGLEITDESDREVDLQALARKQWEARARAQGMINGQA